MILYILASKKMIDQFNVEHRKKIDDFITRNTDSNNQIEREEKGKDQTKRKKEEKMYGDADDEHSQKRLLHNRLMLKLALDWNCLEVAKDLIIRGSIENITVSI
jgi:hypothetical protein